MDADSAADAISQLVQLELDKESYYSVLGTATNVNTTTRTCDLEPFDGTAKRLACRLQSIVSETKGFVLIPKENSTIGVTFFDNHDGFVSSTSELQKIHMESNGEDLKDILLDLMTEINAAIIATPSGPGSIMPSTQTLITAIKTRVSLFFD